MRNEDRDFPLSPHFCSIVFFVFVFYFYFFYLLYHRIFPTSICLSFNQSFYKKLSTSMNFSSLSYLILVNFNLHWFKLFLAILALRIAHSPPSHASTKTKGKKKERTKKIPSFEIHTSSMLTMRTWMVYNKEIPSYVYVRILSRLLYHSLIQLRQGSYCFSFVC